MKKSPLAVRKEALRRQSRIRSTIFAVIVIGVLGMAGYYLKSAFFRPPPEPMAGNVIDLETSILQYQASVKEGGGDFIQTLSGSYLGPIFRVKQGQQVQVRFYNELPDPTIIH